ncbi:NAD(P)/FAD-dependent oxidoreductase [Aurantimonas sp. A3-2-R12]|uniref:NAD(P)/FAD-dependent oxidoreductase n=1 Tax=Aurantimonas sp. A3-2-R12 TaxID=3114362 RepID=UPI003FA45442
MDYDAIILGAGGAGLLAAATAGKAGARICVIDHADRPGKKILISGGGRRFRLPPGSAGPFAAG